ncbi:hypothetical protein AAG906_006208 [Vitis piasezkii]
MENPRELIVGPTKQWPTRSEERVSLLKDASTFVHDNGNLELMFWKNRKRSSGGNYAQALEPLKRLSNAQVPKELAAKERAEPGFCHRVKDFWLDAVAMDASSFLERQTFRGLILNPLSSLTIEK